MTQYWAAGGKSMYEMIAVIFIMVSMMVFMIIREHQNAKIIDKLTNKIMAGDWKSYAPLAPVVENKSPVKVSDTQKKPRPRDSVLGSEY